MLEPSASAPEHFLKFHPTIEGLEHASRALRELLEARPLDADVRYNVEVVFEEIGTNIVRYASPSCDVELTITFKEDVIVLAFTDDGQPFDPRKQPNPPEPSSIDEAPVGGLGLMLVRKIATGIHYERTLEHNYLTLGIPCRAVAGKSGD